MKLALTLLALLSPPLAVGQTPGQAQKKDFPCAMSDFRVASATELRIRCRTPWQEPFRLMGDLVEVGADGQWIEATRRGVELTTDLNERRWMRAALVPGSAPIESMKTYALRTMDRYVVDSNSVLYERQTIEISTKPVAVVTFENRDSSTSVESNERQLYVMVAKVAVDPATLAAGAIVEDPDRYLNARFDPYLESVPSSGGIGRVRIGIGNPGPKSLNSHLTLSGVKDVLGGIFVIPAKQRLKLPGAPKDKESAAYYLRFLHQSSSGAKPGYAADVKVAPRVKNLGNGYFLTPTLVADLGLRKVDDTKVSNIIKAGLGVTRLFMTGGAKMPAVQLTPTGSLETDRTWHHRNVLLDADVQFFGSGWLNSIKSRNERAYARAAKTALDAGDDPPDPDSLSSATWGWQLQLYLGAEVGRALSADEAKSSDEATSVTLPSYTVARVRPKVGAMVEHGRLSVTVALVPRLLLSSERVTREREMASADDPAKTIRQIYLDTAQDFKVYGETTINWQLDAEGHYALTSAYKRGRQPPNFDAVNTSQSGVTIKF